MATAPNAWCVVHGEPGKDPLTIEGPFATEEEAQANANEDQQKFPTVPVMVDVLVNLVENC